jgi:hypothetical protein
METRGGKGTDCEMQPSKVKAKTKLTFTICDPDEKTAEWIAEKILAAYLNELDEAFAKACKAIGRNKSARIRTKPLTIKVEPIVSAAAKLDTLNGETAEKEEGK